MNWFSALIVVSAAGGLSCLLVPDENSPSGRLLRLIASLAVLAVALSPLAYARSRVTALFSDFEAFITSFDGETTDDTLEDSAGRAFCTEIAARVCDKFALPADRIKIAVTVETSDGVPALTHVRVSIFAGDETPDPDEVSSFVEAQTGAECETVILVKESAAVQPAQ